MHVWSHQLQNHKLPVYHVYHQLIQTRVKRRWDQTKWRPFVPHMLCNKCPEKKVAGVVQTDWPTMCIFLIMWLTIIVGEFLSRQPFNLAAENIWWKIWKRKIEVRPWEGKSLSECSSSVLFKFWTWQIQFKTRLPFSPLSNYSYHMSWKYKVKNSTWHWSHK